MNAFGPAFLVRAVGNATMNELVRLVLIRRLDNRPSIYASSFDTETRVVELGHENGRIDLVDPGSGSFNGGAVQLEDGAWMSGARVWRESTSPFVDRSGQVEFIREQVGHRRTLLSLCRLRRLRREGTREDVVTQARRWRRPDGR